MRNIKLVIAYDGTHFLGWQKTKEGPSIEETLETYLEQILQEKITLQAASRTDAGVHAEGQVVHFYTSSTHLCLEKIAYGLNCLLPSSIVVLSITEMPLSFHPTLDSTHKKYTYWICKGACQLPKHRFFSWHIPRPLSIEKMKIGALPLIGTHDFSSFCNAFASQKKDPTCTLHSIDITSVDQDRLQITLQGNRFLFKMVRNIVGTLVYVGLGKIDERMIPQILQSHRREKGGVTAPAHGLHLMEIFYEDPI